MNCIICGKELTGRRRKYCCAKCAQIGYLTGKAETKPNKSKEVSVLYERFLKAFNYPKTYNGNGNGFFIRVFVAACLECKYSDGSVAKGIGKDRSTIARHRMKVNEKEKAIAKEFLENKNYVYGSKYNNFSYRSKK